MHVAGCMAVLRGVYAKEEEEGEREKKKKRSIHPYARTLAGRGFGRAADRDLGVAARPRYLQAPRLWQPGRCGWLAVRRPCFFVRLCAYECM
jgi:hypothetical protein